MDPACRSPRGCPAARVRLPRGYKCLRQKLGRRPLENYGGPCACVPGHSGPSAPDAKSQGSRLFAGLLGLTRRCPKLVLAGLAFRAGLQPVATLTLETSSAVIRQFTERRAGAQRQDQGAKGKLTSECLGEGQVGAHGAVMKDRPEGDCAGKPRKPSCSGRRYCNRTVGNGGFPDGRGHRTGVSTRSHDVLPHLRQRQRF